MPKILWPSSASPGLRQPNTTSRVPAGGHRSSEFRSFNLPDLANFVCRLDHRLSRFAGEGRAEFRHIHHHAVDAILPGRMWIGHGALTRLFSGRSLPQAHCAKPTKKR